MMPPFAPRTISFAGCRTEAQALARLEQVMDDLHDETIRSFARHLMEANPDLSATEFEDALAAYRALLSAFRAESHADRVATFRELMAEARHGH